MNQPTNLCSVTVPVKWFREPVDVWITEGSPHLLSCEAEGFPHPIVILSRLTKQGRKELSRGVKTASFNLSSNVSQNEEDHFLCESSNEAAKLEKEFKVHVHGQSLPLS